MKNNLGSDDIKLINLYQYSETVDDISKIQKQIEEKENKYIEILKKITKLQSDYHVLIGITAELVDTLEKTISGQPVSSDYISQICFKLFNSEIKQSFDSTRPGTAGELVRSLAISKQM